MKELRLKFLQDQFSGTITSKNGKYLVTFPNSSNVYTYSCNLQELAQKLRIDVSDLLDSGNTYNTGTKAAKHMHQARQRNQFSLEDIMQENKPAKVAALREFYNHCSQATSGEYTLYAEINLTSGDIAFHTIAGSQNDVPAGKGERKTLYISCLPSGIQWAAETVEKYTNR